MFLSSSGQLIPSIAGQYAVAVTKHKENPSRYEVYLDNELYTIMHEDEFKNWEVAYLQKQQNVMAKPEHENPPFVLDMDYLLENKKNKQT